MKYFRICLPILLITALFILSGCQSKSGGETAKSQTPERKEVSDFLGATDQEMTAKKGDGVATSYVHKDQPMIAQRKYQEKVFDMKAAVEYFYADSGTVSQAVAVFDGKDKLEIADNITKQLGEPQEKQEATNETQFCYRWTKNGVSYTLLSPQSAPPALIIEKDATKK